MTTRLRVAFVFILPAFLAIACRDSGGSLPTAATLTATVSVAVESSCEGNVRWVDVFLDGVARGRVAAGEVGQFGIEGAGVHPLELRSPDGRRFSGEVTLSGEPGSHLRFGVRLTCAGGETVLSIAGP